MPRSQGGRPRWGCRCRQQQSLPTAECPNTCVFPCRASTPPSANLHRDLPVTQLSPAPTLAHPPVHPRRTTVTGQACQFPFFVTSDDSRRPQYDCVGPSPGACLNPQGRLEPCAPRPRTTEQGGSCSLPFTFQNT